MKPYDEDEAKNRLLCYGTVFILTCWKDGKIESFLLDNEEVTIEELQNDKPEL